ncbi:hypothetical protein [Arcobacter vandammei]|uniref:hypothetical protein n=1 Tax=Arcobacter vandammei TaxID=2782243 RepID=UPI0018DF73A1|nr:hypothetical protein [Arcobacter vandammei]
MNSIKGLLSILIVLLILTIIVFIQILSPKKEPREINKNPSSIQDRKNALKEVFK